MKDDSVLDNADTFIVQLTNVPSYQLRIECTMFMVETKPCLKEVAASLRTLDNVIKGKLYIYNLYIYVFTYLF